MLDKSLRKNLKIANYKEKIFMEKHYDFFLNEVITNFEQTVWLKLQRIK